MEKIIVEIEGKKYETADKLTLVQIQHLARAIKEVFASSVDLATDSNQTDTIKLGLDFIFKFYELGLAGKIIAAILVPVGGKTNSQIIKYLETKVEELDGETQKRIIEYFFIFTMQRAKDYIPFLTVPQDQK